MAPRIFTLPPLALSPYPMALRPLLLPGMPMPLHDGDGGVNRDMVFSDDNLTIVVDPYLGMKAGDRVDIVWDGEVLDSQDVTEAHLNERLFFFVPSGALTAGWVEQAYYRITRADGDPSEDAIKLRLRIKFDLPGGTDREPHNPWHSELAAPQLPEDVIDNGVDAEWARKGVPVQIARYPGRAAWDTVELRWGEVPLRHQVTDTEAAGDDPIVLIVDQATILAAGDHERLLVHYQVWDEVYNFSSDWSRQSRVDVEAGAWKLDAPFIEQAENDEIDLSRLGDDDVDVRIYANKVPFRAGDTVTVTWVTMPPNREPVTHTESQVIARVPSIVDVTIPNRVIREGAAGTVRATYVLFPADGGLPQSSKRADARIVGEAPLPAPTIFELIGDRLPPSLPRAHTLIEPYPDMAAGDLIDLDWLGTLADGSTHVHHLEHIVSGNQAGETLYLPIEREHIGPLAGGELDVSYRVSDDRLRPTAIRRSSHLNVRVTPLPVELPAPVVLEAPDGVLDPELHPGDVHVQVNNPHTRKGDVLTCYWLGEDPDEGSTRDWIPITEAIEGRPVNFRIARAMVDANLDGKVRVLYTLEQASDGGFHYSDVLDLTIGRLIGELPAPEVLEAQGDTLDPMKGQAGVTARVRYPSMQRGDLVTLQWTGTPGAGTPDDQQLPADDSGVLDFKVPASVIGANINREVLVCYQIKRNKRTEASQFNHLRISAFRDPANQLPHPDIPQAHRQTRVLNLATFTGDARCRVGRWPFIAAGQRIWLRLEGENGLGGPVRINLLEAAQLTSGDVSDGFDERVSRSRLETLGQDTTLKAVCKVAFDAAVVEDQATVFPEADYLFKAHHDWVVPAIARVRDADKDIPDGGSTFQNSLHLSGTSTVESRIELFDGSRSLGAAPTDAAGQWSLTLSRLQPQAYTFVAHALDGSGNRSTPWRVEVLENLTPSIEDVRDSSGTVRNGGTTIDPSLCLTGRASAEREVELFDGPDSKGKISSDPTGRWTIQVADLQVAAHSFTAKALYGSGEMSPPWRITVAATVSPTIASIRDSRREVAVDGYTAETSVTVSGRATANLNIELLDGQASLGNVTVDSSGQWQKRLQNLVTGTHAIKARALYGTRPESAVRRFNVTADVAPTVTRVVDPSGTAIGNGASTYATSVTASGKAAVRQPLELWDGQTRLGELESNAGGDWSRQVQSLATGAHAFTVRALYGSGQTSPAWRISVLVAITPTIDSVRDARGEVGQNGSTSDRSVTVSGKAAPSAQVQVQDNGVSKGTPGTDANGNWSLILGSLGLGSHRVQAVAQYAHKPGSNVRNFSVRAAFSLDPSAINLNGKLYATSVDPLQWPSGTTAVRTPSSGTAPYSYSSSNVNVVRVDANGRIYSRGKGSATITVRDSQGNQGSYPVNVSNVIRCPGLGKPNFSQAQSAAAGYGGRLPTMNELREIHAQYGSRWPAGNGQYWSTDGGGLSRVWTKNLVTGNEQTHKTFGAYLPSIAVVF